MPAAIAALLRIRSVVWPLSSSSGTTIATRQHRLRWRLRNWERW
jgi:hypothetical protein